MTRRGRAPVETAPQGTTAPEPLEPAGRRYVVVGLAASGLAAVRALRSLGAEVLVSEARPRSEVAEAAAEAEALGARVAAGGHEVGHLNGVEALIVSPGVPEGAEVLTWAAQRGLPVRSEVDLGATIAACPYVAVTGTNGKTTTTEMVAAAMRAAGLDAAACGNVGSPFSSAASQGHDALAVELSSFQLRFQRALRPRVSALLNVAPDHLDWHRDFDAYRAAKARIFAYQGEGDVHVGSRDDAAAAKVSSRAPCRQAWFTLRDPSEGEVGYVEGVLTARLDGEHRLGRPSLVSPALRLDAAAAAAVALSFGLAPEPVGEALTAFTPLPHRGSIVAEVGGVRFVDDSKATNPHAALRSLTGRREVVLIAGGRSKGIDLSPLAEAVGSLRGVVAIGEAAEEVVGLFEDRVPVARAGSIEEAVRTAHEMAASDGTVLLAPACASQDMFRDYAERGDRFAAAAGSLGEGGS